MDLPWIGELSPQRIAAGVVLAVVVVLVLRKLFARPPESPHLETRRCGGCGWTGSVSRYKPICPKCGKPVPG